LMSVRFAMVRVHNRRLTVWLARAV
jgi:hypothetical protein